MVLTAIVVFLEYRGPSGSGFHVARVAVEVHAAEMAGEKCWRRIQVAWQV